MAAPPPPPPPTLPPPPHERKHGHPLQRPPTVPPNPQAPTVPVPGPSTCNKALMASKAHTLHRTPLSPPPDPCNASTHRPRVVLAARGGCSKQHVRVLLACWCCIPGNRVQAHITQPTNNQNVTHNQRARWGARARREKDGRSAEAQSAAMTIIAHQLQMKSSDQVTFGGCFLCWSVQ